MAVFQSGRLPAHTARFLPFLGLLHQYIRLSNPTSGVISPDIQTLLEGRVSLRLRPATRLWRAPAIYHSDPDKRCVWKDAQCCSDSYSPVCSSPQEFFHRLPLFSFPSDYLLTQSSILLSSYCFVTESVSVLLSRRGLNLLLRRGGASPSASWHKWRLRRQNRLLCLSLTTVFAS
jgi:hypothetical protein